MNIFYQKHYFGKSALSEVEFRSRLIENMVATSAPDFSDSPMKKIFRGSLVGSQFKMVLNLNRSGFAVGDFLADILGGTKIKLKIEFPFIVAIVKMALGLVLFILFNSALLVMILTHPPTAHRTEYLSISPLFLADFGLLYGLIYFNVLLPRKRTRIIVRAFAQLLEIEWSGKRVR